jgi:GNAT superfamily N-acetyltransferase
MDHPTVTVEQLRPQDVPRGAALFARAFAADPMARLVVGEDADPREFLTRGGRRQIERALRYRHVFGAYEDGQLRGIAVWIPPGVTERSSEPPPWSAVPRLVRLALGNLRPVVRYLRARSRATARAEQAHAWHLAFLATDPAHQGRGIARRLLDHVLDRADRDGVAVWLETYDPANPPLYEHFGFRTTTTVRGGPLLPDLWLMERPPRR